MTKDEEYKGFWFLPQNPENIISGILYFESNNEIRLELIGGFEENEKQIITEILSSKTVDVIHGITSNNENISLFNCHKYSNWNLSSPYPITRYDCYYFVKGKHLLNIKDEIFDRIQIELSSLYEWFPSGIIRNTVTFSKDDKLIETSVTVSENDNWEKVIKVDTDFELKLFGVGGMTSNGDHSEYKLTQNTILEISSINSKRSFQDLLNKIGIFKQFLSFAALSSIEYLQITLFDNDDYQEFKEVRKLIHSIPLYFIVEKEKSAKPKRHQFLFTHKDIVDVFPEIIKKWYGLKQNLAPIRNHLISSIKTKNIFTSLDFLIIVQALEGYHRRFIYKKDKDLKTRMGELIILFKDVKKISNNPINITHLVSSRNYYSHFFEKKTNVLDGVELFYLTNQLRNLLICCVLRLIGFDIELTDRLLNKNEKL